MNEMQKAEVLGKARVKMLEELRRVWEGDVDETLSDIAEEALLEINPERWAQIDKELEGGTDEGLDEHYGKVQEFVTDVRRQFCAEELGSVFAMLSFGPDSGLELELFSSRPQTPPLTDEGNWAEWFRLYEGNLDGGDSILSDRRGRAIG